MKNYSLKNDFLGELIGSFILVLFGTGAVAAAVLYDAHQSLFQIGMIWALAVTFGIYMTRHLSNAHFNPAVSVAMVLTGRMSAKRLPTYISGQFIGSLLGALTVYGIYGSSIAQYEAKKNIVRGTFESVTTAKMFGEYYNQPGGYTISMPLAIVVEALGTFLLVLIIFLFTEGANVGRPNDNTAPILIGLTVGSLLALLASITQAGMNPTRDFAPRLVAWMFGWGSAAFPDSSGGFFWVYILAPLVGGILAGYFFTKILEPAMKKQSELNK